MQTDQSSPFKTLTSKKIVETKWLKLFEDEIIHPNGEPGIYTFVDAIPGIIVIAEENGQIYFIKEYKYPIKQWIWNLVTGGINEGDDPLQRAKDELYEETGLKAYSWKNLGKSFMAPGIASTYQFVYLAQDLELNENTHRGEGDEAISTIKKFSIPETKELIQNGELENGLALSALMRYFVYLEKESPNK